MKAGEGRRGRGESSISLGLPRRLYFSADTPPGCCSCTHISPSPCGKKGVIGRQGLTLRDDKEKKSAKTYYQRGDLAGVPGAAGGRANTSFTCKGQKVDLLASGFVAWIYIPCRGFFWEALATALTSEIKDVQPGGACLLENSALA